MSDLREETRLGKGNNHVMNTRSNTHNSDKQNNKTCSKCKEHFVFNPEDCFWDDKGFGYSTKLVRCPYCNSINVVKHIEDSSLDVNNDDRFYSYNN